ncbi:MAG: glycosyl hydrolase family 28 protein, partial [Candidatus Acidiferrales bacterium]
AERGASNGNDLGARVYNIRDFGAKGDGATLDTAAVQAAIDACTRDQGGTVLVPAGVFAIGTVELKSNVTLHLANSAKLLGTADGKQYHHVDAIPLSGDSTLGDGNVGLIFAVKADNVTIEGHGTIDGQGAQFHSAVRGTLPPAGIGGDNRPYHLLFYQCKNLTLRDIFLNDSAYHSVRIIQSTFVNIDGLRIYNRVNGNNDGFHFISCQHVHVSNCTVQSQDDACALFGSCQFITITNCSFSTRWSVFRFGGGEAENITISNCLIYETYGCPIKMRCGPNSRFENISFSNLVMTNVTGPISIGLGDPPRRPGAASASETGMAAGAPGVVRNISFRGIVATVVVPVPLPDYPYPGTYQPGEIKSCIAVNGAGDTFIENIRFDDVQVTFAGGGTAADAAVRDVPKVAGEYYEAGIFPAYGIYARRVRGLSLANVRFQVSAPELRPALVLDHVEDAAINGLSAQGNPQSESLLRFIATRDVLLTASRVLTPSAVFLQVEGADSKDIIVDGGDLSEADEPLAFRADATEDSVKLRE